MKKEILLSALVLSTPIAHIDPAFAVAKKAEIGASLGKRTKTVFISKESVGTHALNLHDDGGLIFDLTRKDEFQHKYTGYNCNSTMICEADGTVALSCDLGRDSISANIHFLELVKDGYGYFVEFEIEK